MTENSLVVNVAIENSRSASGLVPSEDDAVLMFMAFAMHRPQGWADLDEVKCEECGVRRAMDNDILCEECSDRYATRLRSARDRTRRMIGDPEEEVRASGSVPEAKPESLRRHLLEASDQSLESERHRQPQLLRDWMRTSGLLRFFLLGIGLVALAAAVLFKSTNLVFVGLGLTFWGVLLFFVQPHEYVKLDLMNTAGLSSLEGIDKLLVGLGYRERGVYIPVGDPDKVVVFVPTEQSSRIPSRTAIKGKTLLDDPKGLLIAPPGLALSNLIERKLGFELKNSGVEALVGNLRKVLVEDLDIVRDVEVKVERNVVKFRLIDSKYARFCQEFDNESSGAGLGCPMCSALACVLAIASGKPVRFEEDELSVDGRTTESSYELMNENT